jgi:putative PIN family toxin of toxin-antitoxin system
MPPRQLTQIIDRLLRAVAFEVVLSSEIIDEVLLALAYPTVQKAARTKLEPDLWFEDIVVLAQLVTGQQKVPPLSEDPDDDKYVAAAIEGRATFVVTGDPDLLTLKEHEGVRIVSPRTFLTLL